MTLTPQQMIDRIVAFEKDLAAFYESLPLHEALQPLEKISRFMSQHSAIHAEMIANYRTNAAVPRLQLEPLIALHERLKSSLRDELAAAETIDEAATRLARAEEVIGLAYAKIAAHYAEVSDIYRMIASKFDALADDERSHRDTILREKSRLGKTAATSPPENDS